jgi:hypothetical protein
MGFCASILGFMHTLLRSEDPRKIGDGVPAASVLRSSIIARMIGKQELPFPQTSRCAVQEIGPQEIDPCQDRVERGTLFLQSLLPPFPIPRLK